MPGRTKCMGCICHYDNSSDCFLKLIGWMEKLLFLFYDREDPVIVTWYSAKINRNDHFCFFCNSFCQLVIIHFQRIFLCINKNQLCPDMTHHRCTCGIGISASDHFIAFVDSQKTKCHFRTCSLRIQAYSSIGAA